MSFHVDGPKTEEEEKREPTVQSPVRGIWRLGVSEAELTVRHFDVTNMSRYVTPRGSSWLPAPFAFPRAFSGTRPRPPPARDPGSKKHRTGSA